MGQVHFVNGRSVYEALDANQNRVVVVDGYLRLFAR
jgi:hypothetical protein